MTKPAAWLLLMATSMACGCGKPSPPPPGAPTEKPEAPQIEGLDGGVDAEPAVPTEGEAAHTTSDE
jgi:hypothetical protein